MLVHSAPRTRDGIFPSELHMARRQVDWLDYYEHHSRQHGRLTPEDLGRLRPDWREHETWACGPAAAALLDTAEDHRGREGFASVSMRSASGSRRSGRRSSTPTPAAG
ncbi:hypothetical protein [Streptomyces spectabilis]|uniref:Ferredoxin-NADP reductase n=1 Tax=Streptomyces spectabilis TaxID=68270 RepID=A0A5P2XFE0_STRST|nr:hypothetical protein [Streptomyces spectabilis]MBB5105622.1 ferredoxin-NADP reductase [Streptomyces spectabilis]QEV63603.1 hypothetical protein CP982_36955 [Streptomyces spectabilis]GGV22838.1 hypothetical protein GCM10010245_38280 [Streptomyces spectabilis]